MTRSASSSGTGYAWRTCHARCNQSRSAYSFPGIDPGGLVRKVFDFIRSDAPATLPQKDIRRLKGESFDYLLTDNPDTMKNQLIHDFPHEVKGIEKFFRAARSLGVAFRKSAHLCRTTETMGLMEKGRHSIRALTTMLPFLRYIPYTASGGLKKFFKDEALKSIFCSQENLLSCLVPIGWSYMGDYHHAPKTGSCAFPKWLVNTMQTADADILLNHQVSEIRVENNCVQGVVVQHKFGKCIIDSDVIVAACDVDTLYRRLLPAGTVNQRFLNKLDQADIYPSSLTVYLGLDCLPRDLGMGTEMVFLTRDGIPRTEHNNSDPHLSAISVFSPSMRDPSLSPEGKGTLVIFVQAAYQYGKKWHTEKGPNGAPLRGTAYRKFKREYADILIRRVEAAHLPGLRDHIELCVIATPMTFHRYTGNRDGSMMGARPGRRNMKAGIVHYRTAVKNLYISGHWAEYGGGVPNAVRAALNSSLLIMKTRNPAYYNILKNLADGKMTSEEAHAQWERV